MGLISAAVGAVGGGLADQWLEVIEAGDMGEGVVLAKGVAVRTDKRNTKQKRFKRCRFKRFYYSCKSKPVCDVGGRGKDSRLYGRAGIF